LVQFLFDERNTFAYHQSDVDRIIRDDNDFKYNQKKLFELLHKLFLSKKDTPVWFFVQEIDLYMRKKGAVRDTFPIRLFIGYMRIISRCKNHLDRKKCFTTYKPYFLQFQVASIFRP
jgi:hypothetical protein